MFKEKLLLENPHAKIRRTIAIILYVLFMIWVIYLHSKTNNKQLSAAKKTASAFQ